MVYNIGIILLFVKGVDFSMIKVGIADYGMNVWYGDFYDSTERMDQIKAIGYDGLERMRPIDTADAMNKAVVLARRGMSFATVAAPNVELSIKWTAAFGRKYVWNQGWNNSKDLDEYCRMCNEMSKACRNYGIRTAVHNHLGTKVETQEQLETFLEKCPDAGLIFDIGHLGAAGGNVREIFDKYYDRIVAVHLKDWKIDPKNAVWKGTGYFCALGEGVLAEENRYVVENCIKRGFDGWILVEQDTHMREPLEDLKQSRELIRTWGLK